MIPENVVKAMRREGALLIKKQNYDGQLVFDIDYYLVQKFFPGYLEELVRSNLNEDEKYLYDNGFIAYLVRADGMLDWGPTRKTHNIMRKIYTERMLQYPYG